MFQETKAKRRAWVTRFVLEDFLPYQMAVATQRISREFAAIYRDRFGISVAEWRVVAHLSGAGAVSVREVHERVDMDKSRVSRAAARLEERGYVSKTTDTGDRRLVALALTPKGRALIDEMAPLARAYEDRVMAELGGKPRTFRESLETLMTADREEER